MPRVSWHGLKWSANQSCWWFCRNKEEENTFFSWYVFVGNHLIFWHWTYSHSSVLSSFGQKIGAGYTNSCWLQDKATNEHIMLPAFYIFPPPVSGMRCLAGWFYMCQSDVFLFSVPLTDIALFHYKLVIKTISAPKHSSCKIHDFCVGGCVACCRFAPGELCSWEGSGVQD